MKSQNKKRTAGRLALHTLLSLLMPGAVLWKKRPVMAGALLLMDAAVLVCASDVLMDPVALLTNHAALAELALWGVMWVALGVLSVFGVFVDGDNPLGWKRYLGLIVASSVAVAPAVVGAQVVVPMIRTSKAVFITAPVAMPSDVDWLPNNSTVTTTGFTLPTARVNVLLLGGDAGPNRWGLRTDAMHLVSIDLHARDVAVISIPRNLGRAPMPAGLKNEFPKGFNNIANAVYGWGATNPDKVIKALGPTDDAGATLTAAMVAELTGLRIDAWVLVDMHGFLEIIDAFGGVNVWVSKWVKTPGNIKGGKHPLRDFSVGWHHMDGTDALGYSRSRTSDSDYMRMTRQRCVLASLAAQTTPVQLAWRWNEIANVLRSSVRTNLTAELVTALRTVVGVSPDNARVLSLNPPLVPSYSWDPVMVRAVVSEVITPSSVRVITPPAVVGEKVTATTLPVPRGTESLDAQVADECRTKP